MQADEGAQVVPDRLVGRQPRGAPALDQLLLVPAQPLAEVACLARVPGVEVALLEPDEQRAHQHRALQRGQPSARPRVAQQIGPGGARRDALEGDRGGPAESHRPCHRGGDLPLAPGAGERLDALAGLGPERAPAGGPSAPHVLEVGRHAHQRRAARLAHQRQAQPGVRRRDMAPPRQQPARRAEGPFGREGELVPGVAICGRERGDVLDYLRGEGHRRTGAWHAQVIGPVFRLRRNELNAPCDVHPPRRRRVLRPG